MLFDASHIFNNKKLHLLIHANRTKATVGQPSFCRLRHLPNYLALGQIEGFHICLSLSRLRIAVARISRKSPRAY